MLKIRRFFRILILGLCLLTSTMVVRAQETEEKSQSDQLELLTFRLNQMTFVYYHQLSLKGGAYWSPGIWLLDGHFEGRLQLGTNLIKAHADSFTLFWAPEIQALIGYRFWNRLLLEVGMGTQYWKILDGNFKTLYTTQAHYFFPEKLLGFIDSVYLGYTGLSDYEIHSQYRVGFQFRF